MSSTSTFRIAVLRLLVATALVAVAIGDSQAQSPVAGAAARSAATPGASATSSPEYHPSLGDLMTLAVQPRHIKLGLAGQRANWAYAAYELSELRNAFSRVGRTIPLYRSTDMAALIESMTRPSLAAVERAIHDKDSNAFESSYAQLTATCNACHIAQDHAMVIIQVPRQMTYPDQDFAPRR